MVRIAIIVSATLALGLTFAWDGSDPATSAKASETDRDLERGRFLYRVYCVACHGSSGTGDGPVADDLRQRPADLTRLAAASETGFDRDAVAAAIYGISDRPGHRGSEMPLWGFEFREPNRDDAQEGAVRERIDKLVTYLESIQER